MVVFRFIILEKNFNIFVYYILMYFIERWKKLVNIFLFYFVCLIFIFYIVFNKFFVDYLVFSKLIELLKIFNNIVLTWR